MSEDVELRAWLGELCRALDLPPDLIEHQQLILDVARDAAHGVMRPAAPLTTFLVGFAAGSTAGSMAAASTGAASTGAQSAAIEDAAATASALALAHGQEE